MRLPAFECLPTLCLCTLTLGIPSFLHAQQEPGQATFPRVAQSSLGASESPPVKSDAIRISSRKETEKAKLKPKPPASTRLAPQQAVEHRPPWDLKVTKWTLGIAALGHNGTDFDVRNNFSGITTPGVNAFRSTTWTSDFQAQWTRNWQNHQFFVAPAYSYNIQNRGQPDDVRQVNQIADLGILDIGYAYLWHGAGPEHTESVLTLHFETPLARTFTAFPLATTHTGPHGEQIRDQIRFALDRSYTEFVRPGFRWLRRRSSLEFGPEWAHEWNALEQIDFITNGTVTPCSATAAQPISQCLGNAIRTNPQAITPNSEVDAKRLGRDHAGIYWKLNLTITFHPKVSYVFTDAGDWFLFQFHTDNSTDTFFRDYSQHQLKFNVFPNFSIGPEVDLLFYQNKAVGALRGHFLRQDQAIMKAQFSFDLFNHRKR